MLSDTHAHLDFPEFDKDREEVLTRARESNIGYIINIGVDLASSRRSCQLASSHKLIFSSVGIHPHYAKTFNQNDLDEISILSKQDRVVAIGEIGLDYYRNFSGKESQKKMFLSLLSLANEKKLPVVIHNRQASEDIFEILKSDFNIENSGVIHCFCANREYLEKFLDIGFYISFTSNITYQKANDLRELVRYVPDERLLLETDCPFLSPQAKRGERNEPCFVKFLAQELAKIRNIDFESLCRITYDNGKRLFRINNGK